MSDKVPTTGHAHLAQSPPDRACLLLPEIEGQELLVLVEFAQILSLLLVCNGQDAGDGFPDSVPVQQSDQFRSVKYGGDEHSGELRGRSSSDLLHPE